MMPDDAEPKPYPPKAVKMKLINMRMTVMLEDAYVGTLRRRVYVFQKHVVTIGSSPFDDLVLNEEHPCSPHFTVTLLGGNSFKVCNDGEAVIKVNDVTLKNAMHIHTAADSAAVVIESVSHYPLKVIIQAFTPPDPPVQCEHPAFWTCVNAAHKCKQLRMVFPASLVRSFTMDAESELVFAEWDRQEKMLSDFLKKYGVDSDKWPIDPTCDLTDFVQKYGEDSQRWPDAQHPSKCSNYQALQKDSEEQWAKAMRKREQRHRISKTLGADCADCKDEQTPKKKQKKTHDEELNGGVGK